MNYNLFDWMLLTIVAYSTIKAFIRGIILELFSLGGLIAGILLASYNYEQVAFLLRSIVKTSTTAQILAFFLIAIGIMLLSSLLGKLLNHTAQAIGLGFFDRLMGAAFGFLRGCLIGVVILMAIAAFLPQSQWIEDSQLSSYFLAGAHGVSFVVSHDLQQRFLSGAGQLKHTAPDWIKPHR